MVASGDLVRSRILIETEPDLTEERTFSELATKLAHVGEMCLRRSLPMFRLVAGTWYECRI